MLLSEVLDVLEDNNLPYKYQMDCFDISSSNLWVCSGYIKFRFECINNIWELIQIKTHDVSLSGRDIFFQIDDEGDKFSILAITDYECTISNIFYEDIYNTHENPLTSIISSIPLIQYWGRDREGNPVLIGGDN